MRLVNRNKRRVDADDNTVFTTGLDTSKAATTEIIITKEIDD